MAATAVALVLGFRTLVTSDAVRRAVERQAAAALGQPVHIGALRVGVYPRVGIRLRDVVVGEPAALTLDHVAIATGLLPLLRRHVTDADLVVSDSRISIPLPFALPSPRSGSGPGAAESGAGPAAAALVIDSIERIALRNVQIVTDRATVLVDLDSSLRGDRLEVQRLGATSESTDLTVNGVVTSLSNRQGAFTARADALDLDELLAVLTSLGAATPAREGPGKSRAAGVAGTGGARRPLDFRLNLEARTGRAFGVTFTALATDVRVTPSGALLESMAVHLFGGSVQGRLAVDTGPSSRAVLRGRASGLDLPQVLAYAGASPVITGRLAGAVSLAAPVAEAATVFRSATGTIDLDVTGGTIPGLGIVRHVVLAFGRPAAEAPAGNGESFSRIAGAFRLAGGVLESNSLVLESRDFDLRGSSSLNLLSGQLEVDADLVLSPQLTAQAGRDLVRLTREGNRAVLPAKVWGTLAEPRVFVDVEGALVRAAKNLAKDAAKRNLRIATEKLLGRIKPPQ